SRLGSNYVVQHNDKPPIAIKAARIKYGGRYDPEPGALDQLKAILANDNAVDFQCAEVAPAQLGDEKIAFLTTTGEGQLTPAEADAIAAWGDKGGTLGLDAAGGSETAHSGAAEMLKLITKNKLPAPLPSDDPVLSGKGLPGGFDNTRVQYRLFALSKMGP